MSRTLSGAVKLISQQANDNNQLCDLRFGTVVSVSPLKVKISNQLTLPQSVLIVPEHLTDYETKITTSGYGWNTETASSHNHGIELKEKKIKIHNALKVNDKVALIRKTGGQSYFILDRI